MALGDVQLEIGDELVTHDPGGHEITAKVTKIPEKVTLHSSVQTDDRHYTPDGRWQLYGKMRLDHDGLKRRLTDMRPVEIAA